MTDAEIKEWTRQLFLCSCGHLLQDGSHYHDCPTQYVDDVTAAIQAAAAQARLEEFETILRERPLDPTYWDIHHRAALEAAVKEPTKRTGTGQI